MVDKALIAKLREKYMQCPPEGMSADEIREMDDEDLLDMDYFMHEDDEFFVFDLKVELLNCFKAVRINLADIL